MARANPPSSAANTRAPSGSSRRPASRISNCGPASVAASVASTPGAMTPKSPGQCVLRVVIRTRVRAAFGHQSRSTAASGALS